MIDDIPTWLRNLGSFMHANGHPFDGDELEEVAQRYESTQTELQQLRLAAELRWYIDWLDKHRPLLMSDLRKAYASSTNLADQQPRA